LSRAAAAFLLFIASELEAQNWPQFRGPDGSGVADGQALPLEWSLTDKSHLAWQVPIEGLAHSSPIVWGDRLYLTTAVAETADAPTLMLGDSDAAGIDTAPDLIAHRWEILALDKNTGAVLFKKTAHQGVPRLKRHVKASHASATPATDGRNLVALLGTEGLFCFDMEGELRWRLDLGLMDVGYWGEP
jgi:outer membrane protein assembly factor BamB